jgi:acyl transferase domain-containing protein
MEDNDAAVAAGVNLMLLAGTTAAICQLQALSPVGRCQTFDAAADGYGRGEGCAVAVLREFTGDASAAVHVLVRGSAVNQVHTPAQPHALHFTPHQPL